MSQFILDPTERASFFRQIANRLWPDGILASADLASDTNADGYDTLLGLWQQVMTGSDASP